MVRLNAEQEKYLTRLQEAKRDMDREFARIEAEAKVKKEQARQPVKQAIQLAINAGTPRRQVAIKGLGYADVNSLKQYENYPERSTENLVHIPAASTGRLPILAAVSDWDTKPVHLNITDSAGVAIPAAYAIRDYKKDGVVQIQPLPNLVRNYDGSDSLFDIKRAAEQFVSDNYDQDIEWVEA